MTLFIVRSLFCTSAANSRFSSSETGKQTTALRNEATITAITVFFFRNRHGSSLERTRALGEVHMTAGQL